MKIISLNITACAIVLSTLLFPQVANAYIGPGAGLTAIGTVIALIGGVLLAIVGFVWYPLKRYLRNKKKKSDHGSKEDGQ